MSQTEQAGPDWPNWMIRHPVLTVVAIAILSRLGTLIVGLPIIAFVTDDMSGFSGAPTSMGATDVLAALVIAPVLESLLVLVLVYFAYRFTRRVIASVAASAAMLTLLHGFSLFALTVAPSFVISPTHNWFSSGTSRQSRAWSWSERRIF